MSAVDTAAGPVPAVPAPAAAAGAPPAGRPLPAPVAVLAAVLAGLALLAAFPPYDVWWLAPVAVALAAASVHRRRARTGAGLGLLTGLAFFVPLLSWTNLHTGSLPWVLLSVAQAAYLAGVGAVGAYGSALVDRWRVGWPVLVGGLWVVQEAARARWPFGGFPWGRLAFSQADGPLLPLASLGGAPLVTFATAVAGGLLLAALWRPWPGGAGRRWLPVAGFTGALLLVGSAAAVPPAAPGGPSVTVAIVQGNVPRLGLDFNAQRRAVLDNHVAATVALAADVAAGRQRAPQLVVWPENASDIDPLRNADAAEAIGRATGAVGVPILVGAVVRGPGPDRIRNVGLLWRPVTGPDTDQLYVKRHPVPFAEYVPLRRIARLVSTQVDLVRADMLAGTRAGVVRTGPVVLGDVICFEVAYDSVVRDTVTGGAQLLAVQTNNATFNRAEALQQMAMVRLRAVEHGRSALMASTVGVSGFVGADGRVDGATGFNTAAVVVREVPVGTPRTLASRLGVWPEVVLVGFAAGVLAGCVSVRRRRVRTLE